MEDLVSIIIPVYKVENYMGKSIESVLGQSYSNLEIILVDDGSPDGCPAICDAYQKRDNRVKVIHKENGGLSSARNVGIDAASGKYIAFVDSDDIVHKDFIKVLYDLCETYDCDIAQCDFLETNEHSVLLSPQRNREVAVYNPKEIMKDFCKDSNIVKYWVAWNKLYRRELFSGMRYPEGKVHEDMFISHQLLWKSRKTAVTNLYLYYYLQRNGSITKNEDVNPKNSLDKLDAMEELTLFFKEKNLGDEFEYMLYKFYFTAFSSYQNILKNKELVDSCNCIDEIKKKFMKKVDCAKGMILDLSVNDLSVKLGSIYPSLSEKEKDFYRNTYGSKITEQYEITYGFPFEKIPPKTRVAIYAAGHVGQSYYKQITKYHYVDIVVWVDNSWKVYTEFEIPVEPIDALFRCDFDYLLIALENETVAMEVIDNLVNWGINREKILFEHPQPSFNNARIRDEFIAETNKLEKCSRRRWFVMNSPDHDNLGDHALTIGTLKFMHDYFDGEEIIEITGRQWDTFKDRIILQINRKDILIIVGGGYMGDLWPVQDGRVKQIIDTFPNNKVIFFPQTFYYSDTKKSVIEADKKIYNGNKNIFFIHREENSYKRFVGNVVCDADRNRCFPDLALYLSYTQKKQKRDGILLCLRLDKESVSGETRTKLLDLAHNSGKRVTLVDSVLDRSIGRYDRSDEVLKILNIIADSELLITDRLHPMIFAAVTGTPCIAFDNLSGKVSGVYQWIKELDYIICTDADRIDANLIEEYANKKRKYYDISILENEFAEMADVIKGWIDS